MPCTRNAAVLRRTPYGFAWLCHVHDRSTGPVTVAKLGKVIVYCTGREHRVCEEDRGRVDTFPCPCPGNPLNQKKEVVEPEAKNPSGNDQERRES